MAHLSFLKFLRGNHPPKVERTTFKRGDIVTNGDSELIEHKNGKKIQVATKLKVINIYAYSVEHAFPNVEVKDLETGKHWFEEEIDLEPYRKTW